MIEKNIVSFYNFLIINKIMLIKHNLCYMYIMFVYVIKYKVMMIINIIIPGKTEEWGFILS